MTGPGGAQVLAIDPSGNLVELFQPAAAHMITPGIDHIALTVPDLDAAGRPLRERVRHGRRSRFDGFALVTDPASG